MRTERERYDAYKALRQTFGSQTDAVIEMLRPDQDDLATKDDIGDLRVATQADIHELRGEFHELRGEFHELRAEFQELRGDFLDFKGEVRTDIAGLRTEMQGLRVEFANGIQEAFTAQTRVLLIGLISAIVLIALSNSLAIVVS